MIAAKKFRIALPSLIDVVPCYQSIGLYFKDTPPDLTELSWALESKVSLPDPKHHEIPVCYELGQDLEHSSCQLGISTKELIERHSSTEYRCAAVGFTPGFPYLGDLNPKIAGLPRLDSPRPRVEAGSVGITGRQTAVYPSLSPGGWNLIGQTPLTIVDLSDGYFPIEAGDYVKFFPIARGEFEVLKGQRL